MRHLPHTRVTSSCRRLYHRDRQWWFQRILQCLKVLRTCGMRHAAAAATRSPWVRSYKTLPYIRCAYFEVVPSPTTPSHWPSLALTVWP